MAKSFTEREKENIKRKLQEACRQSWTQYGYKKTGVDELCRLAGISKGAFYLFFESKEALFCEVLCSVQKEICEAALKVMERQKGRDGVAEALKLIYREYDNHNFLYDSNSTDFAILMNKLSEEQAKRIEESNEMCRQLFLNHPYLKLKVDSDLALSVIYSLIMNIKNKDVLPYNHRETFSFMVDHLVESLFIDLEKEAENENGNCKKK